MRAVVISKPGGPDVLEIREVETPAPSRGEVRVRVKATAVNRADILQRMGRYPAPAGAPRDIPGLEIAGEVDAVGQNVGEFAVGDRVFGIVSGGAYAEYVVAHARTLARLPASLSFLEAASIPEVFTTAWDAMVDQGDLAAGETVLIHAVGSGVGTAALQIALALHAFPIGTSRSEDKIVRARELGLVSGILTPGGAFAGEVRARSGGKGANVIVELVGGTYIQEDLACIALKGRIVVVGTMGGTASPIDLRVLMRQRARIVGTMLRSRPIEEKIYAALTLGARIVPLFEMGVLRSVIDCVLPLDSVADAHRKVESGVTFGKVVLEL